MQLKHILWKGKLRKIISLEKNENNHNLKNLFFLVVALVSKTNYFLQMRVSFFVEYLIRQRKYGNFVTFFKR